MLEKFKLWLIERNLRVNYLQRCLDKDEKSLDMDKIHLSTKRLNECLNQSTSDI